MHLEDYGANGLSSKELEALFDDDFQPATPPEETTEPNPSDEQRNDVSQTKAFAKRLAEEKAKVVNEERENIAKSLGFTSYEELQREQERKLYKEKGLDHEEISPIVDELVKQRIDSDPRMKELERFKAQQVEEFGKKELAEITKLTNGEITKLEQLPREVLDLWKQKGSLKSAYLELKGEELILKARGEQSKGSTSHMANLSGASTENTGKRHLTEQEKQMWRLFNPSITEEELNKKTVEK
jgi:hypothetical protein